MSEILISDLTDGTISGSGAFDIIMQTVTTHLQDEFNKGRLKGPDYAKVELGAIQTAMSQGLQFVLQRQAADKQAELINAQIALVEEQLVGIGLDNDIKTKELVKLDAEIVILATQEELLTAQKDIAVQQALEAVNKVALSAQEVLIAGHQVATAEQQSLLTEQQVAKTTQDVALTTQQVLNAAQQKLNLVADELQTKANTSLINKRIVQADDEILLTQAQVSKLGKDESLIDQQILVAAQQVDKMQQEVLNMVEQVKKTTSETNLLDQNKANAIVQGTVLTKQATKIDSEKSLLDQKVVTETAQVSGSAFTSDSVIGKQTALYSAQTEGFQRDAEQKAAKLLVDTWSVRATTLPDEMKTIEAGVSDSEVKKVLDVLKVGMGSTAAP